MFVPESIHSAFIIWCNYANVYITMVLFNIILLNVHALLLAVDRYFQTQGNGVIDAAVANGEIGPDHSVFSH